LFEVTEDFSDKELLYVDKAFFQFKKIIIPLNRPVGIEVENIPLTDNRAAVKFEVNSLSGDEVNIRAFTYLESILMQETGSTSEEKLMLESFVSALEEDCKGYWINENGTEFYKFNQSESDFNLRYEKGMVNIYLNICKKQEKLIDIYPYRCICGEMGAYDKIVCLITSPVDLPEIIKIGIDRKNEIEKVLGK